MGREQKFTAKIMAKGQITIPVEVRRAHGWREGDTLVVMEDSKGNVYLRVAEESIPDYSRFIGALAKPGEDVDVDRLIEDLRGPVESGEQQA